MKHNMVENDKVATLIGFAIKSKNVVMGFDGISVKKKPPFVIFMRSDTGQNTAKKVEAYAKTKGIKLFLFENLDRVIASSQCKVLAVYDRALSDGILTKLQTKDYTNYTEVTVN